LDPRDIGNRFTMSVAELEGIEEVGVSFDKIVAARVCALRPHERSDRLEVLDLDLGDRTIVAVSGALGIRVGSIIPFALPGAVLEGVEGRPTVRQMEIQGTLSPGVTCSERELAISDDHSGLLELAEDTPVGAPLTELLPVHDFVLEIDNKSLTHRPDLWGHRGIAREIAALVGRPLKPWTAEIPETDRNPLTVTVEAPDLCPRYAAQVFEGIAIGASPLWLKLALARVGVRPISNVVDITNFVMLDVGNPVHAFDARFLRGETIVVRRARPGETIVTLDEVERPLLTEDLLIADGEGGVALAGVMGGLTSEIREDTTRVVLEAASFHAATIRRTSSRLGLRTEASARFEKSLDMEFALQATALFSGLVRRLIPGAQVASRLYDVSVPPPAPTVVRVAPEFVRRRLGAEVSDEGMKKMLEGIEFSVAEEGEEFLVTVPSFRATKDISIPEDIVEEIGRLYGYDNITPVPIMAPVEPTPIIPSKWLERTARLSLVASGYTETMGYGFDSAPLAQTMGYSLEGAVELANPISADLPVLRRSLLPNLLLAASRNAQFRDDFRLFEVARVFWPARGEGQIPHQERHVGGLLFSRTLDSLHLLRLVRGHTERLFDELRRGRATVGALDPENPPPWLVPERTRGLTVAGRPCGHLGILHPVVRDALKLKGKVAFFEVDLEPLLDLPEHVVPYEPLPRFPAIQNDLSVIVEAGVPHEEVARAIRETAGELLAELELFAAFRGDPIPEGRKSLSYRLRFRSPERTLTDQEVEPVMERVLQALRSRVGGEIRT